MNHTIRALALSTTALLAACAADSSTPPDACTHCIDAAVDASHDAATDASAQCSAATCATPGFACFRGACVEDCRPAGAIACPASTVCDYTDGQCRASSADGVLPGTFTPCGANHQCGPGTQCTDAGTCVVANGCTGFDCDDTGRCWAHSCPVDRPPPACRPAPLARLNQADFIGPGPSGNSGEGADDLDFDDACTAYVVTMISGPDYLRQLAPDGTLTQWQSVSNLNMGEVASLRVPGLEGTMAIGEVAGTYICCATCGCVTSGMDDRQGVVHLDRSSTTRPLPNVMPATPTTGTGPFGSGGLDTGPYALTWGGDHALYAGNINANGDFMRVDLTNLTRTMVANFPARVIAATPYDVQHLLVAVEGGQVSLVALRDGTLQPWATLPADPTSLQRDGFTGTVYAELHTSPPRIVALRADGSGLTDFQTAPQLGRIALGPDGYLYHLGVVGSHAIVRWPLPAHR